MVRFLYLLIFWALLLNTTVSAQSCPVISTYFGQSQVDNFKGICRDNKGNVYGIGNTYNNNLPTSVGTFQQTYKNDYEAYVVKFDSCGNFIWCTYFGTSGFDSGEKIAFSPSDTSIVITGYTNGNDLDTTFNCFQPAGNGNYDCFVAKLNTSGQAKWVTYFGSSSSDFSYELCIDKSANIIIGGTSLGSAIHTSSLSFQQNNNGATDAFLAKFSKNGVLKFSTFYGGLNSEDIHAIATDKDNNIIAVGGSFSNNLSTTSACHQSSNNGGMEIYIIKFDSLGNRLFSTYYGGMGTDDAYGVGIAGNSDIYVTGHTNSSDFFKTGVSFQSSLSGLNDNYCLKMTPTGSLIWCTMFGGTSFDNNVRCEVNGNDEVLTLINSQSSDFPMLGVGNTTVNSGAADLVLVKISSSGVLNWSSYKGGTGSETPADLLLLHNRALITGGTSSADFPMNSGNYQLINNGQEDGFITTVAIPNSPITGLEEKTTTCKMKSLSGGRLIFEKCVGSYSHLKIHDLLGRQIAFLQLNSDQVENDLSFLNRGQLFIVTLYRDNIPEAVLKFTNN